MRLNLSKIILPVAIILLQLPALSTAQQGGLIVLPDSTLSPAQQSGLIDNKDIHVVHYEDIYYPSVAAFDRAQGIVVIKVTLRDDGSVADVSPLSGAGVLIEPTMDNAKKWRFTPNFHNAAILVYDFQIGVGCHRRSPYSKMTFYPPNFAVVTNCGPTTIVE